MRAITRFLRARSVTSFIPLYGVFPLTLGDDIRRIHDQFFAHRCGPPTEVVCPGRRCGLARFSRSYSQRLWSATSHRRGDQADLRWLVPGFWMWMLLFGVFPVGWMRWRVT